MPEVLGSEGFLVGGEYCLVLWSQKRCSGIQDLVILHSPKRELPRSLDLREED